MNSGRNWLDVMFKAYGSETKKIGAKYLDSFEMWCWRRMEKIEWPEKVINEVVGTIEEKRTFINNI